MYQYPYGDSQQLNLDWIINKLIELEQSFVAGESAELEEFANALISITYIPTQAYNNSDIVFHDGHLYRCNTTIPAPGEVWDPSHWDQIMLGNTVANLVRAVAGMDSDHVFNESNVPGTHVTEALNALVEDIRYDNHKVQQKKNGAYTDVIPVEDAPSNNSDRLASSKAAYDLKDAINHKLDVYTTTTSSGTGVPTDAEIISSIALNNASNGEFAAQFNLSNGNTAFTIIWVKISDNYASGLGFGYYEDSGFMLRRYKYTNGTLTTYDFYTQLSALYTPETITLDAGNMTFDSGISLHGTNYIVKCGKICTAIISIKLENISSTSAKNIDNYFPASLKPKNDTGGVCETGLGDGKAQPFKIRTDKRLAIFPVNTGTTYCIGSITYICE